MTSPTPYMGSSVPDTGLFGSSGAPPQPSWYTGGDWNKWYQAALPFTSSDQIDGNTISQASQAGFRLAPGIQRSWKGLSQDERLQMLMNSRAADVTQGSQYGQNPDYGMMAEAALLAGTAGLATGAFAGAGAGGAGGAAAGAGGTDVLGAGGLFGAGGAPTTLAGLGGGGGSALAGGLADSVAAGTAGLGAGIGGAAGAAGAAGGAAAGAGGLFGGLGGAPAVLGGAGSSAAGGGGGLLGSVGGAVPAVTSAVNGATGAAGAAGGAAGSGGSWWQTILNGLGGQQGNLGSNLFAGLQGAGLLTSLLGGDNGLSDMLGLTGANASSFRGVNTQGPGGSSSQYNPDTNTVTGSAGNLDPLQAQLAKYSGDQLGQADQSKQQANILDLLRKQSQPYEQNAMNSLNNNLFSRGRLGMEDSNTGTAYKEFAKGLDENDMSRQLAAYQYSQGASNQAFNQATGAANASRNIQLGSFAPTMSSIQPQTPGAQPNPTLDLLHQFLTGVKP